MYPMRRETTSPRFKVWTGTPDRADEIGIWARTGGLVPRWQWAPGDEFARVLVERDYPDSSEWVQVPVGSVIRRRQPDPDQKMEEADWPLEIALPGIE